MIKCFRNVNCRDRSRPPSPLLSFNYFLFLGCSNFLFFSPLEGHFILLWGIDRSNPQNMLFKPPGGFCQYSSFRLPGVQGEEGIGIHATLVEAKGIGG